MERNSTKIIQRLKAEGWALVSSRGSHRKFIKDGQALIVPHPKKDLPTGTAKAIAKQGRLVKPAATRRVFMKTYFALVHHEADSAFGVQFPDLPGVFSAADREADLIANAADALQLAAENADLAAPSSHAVLLERKDVHAALAEGAFLLAVPLIENDTVVERVNVTFERGLLRAIDQAARNRKTTRAGFLARAARNEIERRG